MLQEIYRAEDIKERYQCGSLDTARRYMRQMGAKGAPLFVTEDMIEAWEMTKRQPISEPKKKRQLRGTFPEVMKIPRRK